MTKETSIYLDLMRVVAALLVLFSHFFFTRFTGEYLNFFHQFGQMAVIVFFLLSGYVITYVVNVKEKSLKAYFISRFARLYSVVLPALIFVLIIDSIGQQVNALMYEGYFRDTNFIFRFIANLSFFQQAWFFNIGYLSNGPLWSLGYEFWYYVLFGFSMFLKGRSKYLFLLLTVLIVGPKILLLLPVWLFGSWIYNFHQKKVLSQSVSRVLFILTPILFFIIFNFYVEINEFVSALFLTKIEEVLGFSKGFISDYITGLLLGVHLLSMKYINVNFFNKVLQKSEGLIRYIANSSFTIYLFHFPLLLFFAALFNHDSDAVGDMIILLTVTLLSCFAIALYTEKKKHLYKKYISMMWMNIEHRIKR